MRAMACETCGNELFRGNKRFCSRACLDQSPSFKAAAAARAVQRNKSQLKKHGESWYRSPEYDAWRSTKRRCAPGNWRASRYYAERGIKVCERWAQSFEAFLTDMGRRPGPGFSLDRIDNDADYEPGNVRWATWSEQMKNRRAYTLPAQSQPQTHCKKGHPMDGENLKIYSSGLRRCLTCRQASQKNRDDKRRLRKLGTCL